MEKGKTASIRFVLQGFGLFLLAFLFVSGSGVWAGDKISARYILRAKTVVLEIDVSPPGPGTIILTQHLPGETVITRAEPKYSSYNREKGKAKWLLKDIGPGRHKVTLELASPADPKGLKGVIAYKDPDTGKLAKITIIP